MLEKEINLLLFKQMELSISIKTEKYHREGDKSAIIKADGAQFWYKNGKCHRAGDKPAII